MKTESDLVAFWLRPRAREREVLAELIRELARRYDAPWFEPHVTVQAGAIHPEAAAEILRGVARREPVVLRVAGVAFADVFTKTVFVQFHPSEEAAQLSAAIGAAGGMASGYAFDPHLSLLYRTMPEAERAAVARMIALPFESVVFDSMEAIACPAQITERADVEAWRPLFAQPFLGAS